ncbi:ABC transporter permease subunit [Fictibacillus sp. UD]|uniref:ABC transporter permease subunit n=1 Tax=Fictibacillus sp. UD TaxID=3038777 RepID=UPI0037463888
MRKVILDLQQIVLLSISIILIAAVPSFLADENGINFSILRYGESVLEVLTTLMRPDSLTLYIHSQNMIIEPMPVNLSYEFVNEIYEIPLFPEIWKIVFYTLGMLLISFAAAFIIAVFLGWIAELLPASFKTAALRISEILEAFPDLFFVFCIQLAVVWIYKKTGFLAANPFTSSKEPSFLLPVITLSIVPAIYLFRMQLTLSQAEIEKDYITFARSKGLANSHIVFHHLFKNTLRELSIHLPYIMLLLFSHLIILEYLFNMNGIIQILLSEQPAETRAMLLMLIAFPLFAAVKGVGMFIKKERISNAA